MPSISVVVPVYNSEGTLQTLVSRLDAVLSSTGDEFELLLINDGSRDASWGHISEICARHAWVSGIDLMRNYGQHNALLCGIRLAKFDVIVTMDDDLQNPPEEIPKLLACLCSGCDVVYGAPEVEQHGIFRDLASRITKLALSSSMGVKSAHHVSAFRAFRAELRRAFEEYSVPFVSIDVLLTWATANFCSIQVKHDPRRIGPSNYSFRMLVRHALNMITGFSTGPLQMASLLGFAFTLFGLGVLCYALVWYWIQGGSVPGFTFLASIVAIFSGAQMFALGIIGEYLARMHSRTMARPPFAMRRIIHVPSAGISPPIRRTGSERNL
jgi:undecaprenyl-phosphate 4-deoxy-4-formamido-L-arabinose transferase